jgi:hypothetical protein
MRKLAGAVASAAIVAAIAGPAGAQVSPAADATRPEMRRLRDAFAGTWKTAEEFTPSRIYPKGAQRQGVARFHTATGGSTLVEDVHSDGSAGQLDLMVVIWWDEDVGAYEVFTCAAAGANPCRLRGEAHWEGHTFVNTYVQGRGDDALRWRDTFSDFTPTSFTLVAAIETPSGAMRPIITTHYVREDEVTPRVSRK